MLRRTTNIKLGREGAVSQQRHFGWQRCPVLGLVGRYALHQLYVEKLQQVLCIVGQHQFATELEALKVFAHRAFVLYAQLIA